MLGGRAHPADRGRTGRWFAYKFSSGEFLTADNDPARACPFGGTPLHKPVGQRYAFASSATKTLTDGPGLIGTSGADPLGATFGDLNQQGQLGSAAKPNDPKICASSQNGHGGMFFVIDDADLAAGVSKLLTGTKADYPK